MQLPSSLPRQKTRFGVLVRANFSGRPQLRDVGHGNHRTQKQRTHISGAPGTPQVKTTIIGTDRSHTATCLRQPCEWDPNEPAHNHHVAAAASIRTTLSCSRTCRENAPAHTRPPLPGSRKARNWFPSLHAAKSTTAARVQRAHPLTSSVAHEHDARHAC